MHDANHLVQTLAFTLFVVLLGVCVMTTGYRVVDLRRRGVGVPLLLTRDVIVFAFLTLPFVLIFGARMLGLGPSLTGNVGWTLLTSGLAIAALVVFLAYEWLVIGRRD